MQKPISAPTILYVLIWTSNLDSFIFSFDLHPTAPHWGCGVKHPIVKNYKNYPNNMRASTFDWS